MNDHLIRAGSGLNRARSAFSVNGILNVACTAESSARLFRISDSYSASASRTMKTSTLTHLPAASGPTIINSATNPRDSFRSNHSSDLRYIRETVARALIRYFCPLPRIIIRIVLRNPMFGPISRFRAVDRFIGCIELNRAAYLLNRNPLVIQVGSLFLRFTLKRELLL